jgi:hypothetical protein
MKHLSIEQFLDLKSFDIGAKIGDTNYTPGVDFLDRDLLEFKKIHIKIYVMRCQTLI